ncbi:MAG: hypothetical protein ACE5IR_00955 [bacterium]
MFMAVLFLIPLLSASPSQPTDSSKINEQEMARSIRNAVRQADSTLMQTHSLNTWRDYLKFATMDLRMQLQPLVLIKFDEDQSFRNQLKTLIEWESQWQRKETEHYIYYYRWDQPPQEIILQVQDAHFNEIIELFEIEPSEKIPFRYDLSIHKSVVFPFEDLRGGIISPQPIDLEKGAQAIFNFLSQAPAAMLEPLSRIYGTYFQSPSTSEAYYQQCLKEIQKQGYISITVLFERNHDVDFSHISNVSSYIFMYQLDRQFGAKKIGEFLTRVSPEMSVAEFENHFYGVFGIKLDEFEEPFMKKEAVRKY